MSGASRFEVEERLHGLERREMLRRERRSSVGGEVEYAFRHVLVRDVAYGQIPRAQRAEKHRRAAEWIASLSADRENAPDMVAHHYSQALDYTRDAGRDTAEAGAAHPARAPGCGRASVRAELDRVRAASLSRGARPVARGRPRVADAGRRHRGRRPERPR